ncbi:MAG: oligopeptide/dipeptide ABC transporter ATP-binding protein [Promethearchaeota archaeon]
MELPSNITIGTFMSELVIAYLISLLVFLYGISFIKSYVKKKEMDVTFAIDVNLVWFLLNLGLKFVFFYFIGNKFVIIIIADVVINTGAILISSNIVRKSANKNYVESILFIAIFQAILYGLAFLLRIVFNIVRTMVTAENDDVYSSGVALFFTFLIILGVNTFFINWGNKAQFIENRNIITILTLIPGVFYLGQVYQVLKEAFIRGFFTYILWGLIITLIVSSVVKYIAQMNLTFQRYRELTVLEKDKKLLQIKDLKVYYPLIGGMLKRQFGSVKAVNGISFNIKTGETLGLVGESGCGKTTVAKAILGLVPKEAGEIIFNDEPIPNEYTKYLRKKIQIVYQDPDASLNPRMKVVDIIAEPLRNLLGITKKDEIRRRVLNLLHEVSLEREHMDRFPHEFSGGQKQRIIIARALASNPELVILDEPTSALDVSVQAQILNLLKRLQRTYNYGFLFITHNLAVVNHIADKVAVMYLGKFVEVGNTEQIFSNPTHPYTIALLSSRTELDPSDKEIKYIIKGEVPSPIAPPPGCTFNPRCISEARTKECMSETPHPIKIEEGHYIWCVNPPVALRGKLPPQERTEILDN